MKALLTFLFIIIGTLTAASPSYSAQTVSTERSSATLLIEDAPLNAGESIWAGVALTMQPGWHHYWINPGDSGMSAIFEWSLPEGLEAGPVHWPTPERIEYSGLYNYGYSGTVALLTPIAVADDLPEGEYEVTLNVSWLVCKDICIPESAAFTLTLSTQSAPEGAMAHDDLPAYLSAIPRMYEGEASYHVSEHVSLSFEMDELMVGDIKQVWWFPQSDGVITNASDQQFEIKDGKLLIHAERGLLDVADPFEGVLQIEDDEGHYAYYHASAKLTGSVTAKTNDAPPPVTETVSMTLLGALFFAFIGGIILNIMPCVLPILSLKALSISKKADKEASKVRAQGLAYTVGILASFAIIAGLLIVLQQAGHTIGWGFQLQSPAFVTILAYVLFAVGLNLSGVFEVSASFSGVGEERTRGDSLSASFFTGVLATLVATPCTAPFMATAIGFALSQPAAYALLIFLSLGLGLAFPLLAISFMPALYRLLPKPGTWMVRFKQFLAFPIYASAAWMLWVLAQQSGPLGLAAAFVGVCLIAFVAWLLPMFKTPWLRAAILLSALAVLYSTIAQQHAMPDGSQAAHSSVGEPFSAAALNTYRTQGTPVFVDATAAWCITCKVNERLALNVESVQQAFAKKGIKFLVADWTNRDAEITDYLASFGRNGVPLYVYYPTDGDAVVLPQLLTPSIVLDTIE